LLLDLLALEPENAQAMMLLSGALSEMDEHAEALETARRAVALVPGSTNAYWQYGMVLLRAKRPAEAQSAFERAIAIKPDHAPVRVALAKALIAQRRAQPALEALESAMRFDPAVAEAWTMKALILTQLGRKEEAARAADEALRLAPESPRAHLAGGLAALARLDAQRALTGYREALRNDPTDAAARAGYVAAARLSLPIYAPIARRSRVFSVGLALLAAVAFVFLTLVFENVLLSFGMTIVLVVVVFRALHMTGTLLIYNDRLVRHALARIEMVTAYWFFADLAVLLVGLFASVALRNGGFGWIAISCGLGAVATAVYGAAAELPRTVIRSYRFQRVFAVFGLVLTAIVQTASLALGGLMAITGAPGTAGLLRAQHEYPYLTQRVLLPLVVFTGLLAAFVFMLFGVVTLTLNMARRVARRARPGIVHA
jgi:tetratricopeptide (TPR) repeat protein